ncbi:hypothetical protein CWO91_16650 [Bradyrhizobium genosp. SA-3]|uniref:hypothetical protein n=1 Tax=Bradyrhizobium genosp. SA-3 TaxID=508868 RepID=UPI0010297288|nr:hypothetical protein [Bradyrhizobium genosp. SA-3]RZN09657.1 hypothetical protein CWO91_16650 [Bradyrhizobium genosp. SA-3]
MWSETHPRWLLFAGEVVISAEELEREYQMSVEVKGLADIVRQAKDAIRTASDAAAGMRASANELTSTVGQVLDMQRQLDAANADLKAAVGAMSNGGPPLDAPASSSSGLTVDQAASVVAAQNAS